MIEKKRMNQVVECLSRMSTSHVDAQPHDGINLRIPSDDKNQGYNRNSDDATGKVEGKEPVCGRGILCKPIPPFGIKNERPKKAFARKVLNEISKWKLEGDDFMI
eukprot:CAMPEP_0197257648 /NCGR_PEP_ID=MMETSP1429-20130617/79480_1 /TAXON_ID=49237 /ORGANISM="Chaetoceros  sp., Strain UNC1202" /LENGTH=104 /DNA_ID=CAMNT_0042721555 /DNA_START=88 /DNA_END=402 /DNA_ORIENTATION=+